MKTLLLAAVAATVLIRSAQAQGGPFSGNDWSEQCANRSTALACTGYVRGFADGLRSWRDFEPGTARICIPNEAPGTQLRDVALKYIRDNPERRHQSAAFLFLMAFVKAWPCGPQ
jgi:hypothetical protein